MARQSQNTKQLLEEIATCSMCLDLFNKPKSLPCLHTFCLNCLLGFTGNRPGTNMKCPMCRKEFQIPPGGFEMLPSNFLIEQLLQVNAGSVTASGSYEVAGDVDAVDLQSSTENTDQNDSAANGKRLKVCDDKLQVCLKHNEDELKRLDAEKIKFLKEVSDSEEVITKRSNELKQVIESKQKSLIEELEGIKNKRLSEIASRRNDIEQQSTMVVSFQQYSKQILDDGAWGEMEHSTRDLLASAEELVKTGEKFNGNQLREVVVTFKKSPSVNISIGKINLETSSKRPVINTAQPSNTGRTSTSVNRLNQSPTFDSHGSTSSPTGGVAVNHQLQNQSQRQSLHAFPPTMMSSNFQNPPRDNFNNFIQSLVESSNVPRELPSTASGALHPRVTCDACSGKIWGCRYKCRVCPNFDLCESCKSMNHHSEHSMISIETPGFLFAQHQTKFIHSATAEGAIHFGITCDGCKQKVRGVRYKCSVCRNYDLCESCNELDVHLEHDMSAIEVPRKSNLTGSILHRGVTCDGCSGPVRGIRYKCKVCPDFDLCQDCKWVDSHSHHEMMTIEKPRTARH